MSYPSCDTRFTNPTKQERCDGYAELNTGEITIEMFENFFCLRRPFFSSFYFYFELRESDFYQSEFARNKECVQRNEKSCYGYAEYDSETGVRGHILLL